MSRLIIIILSTILLCCGCVREDHLGPYGNSTPLDISKLHPTGTLPVHLGKYDLRAHTKSSNSYSDTNVICIDSLIDFTSVRQVYFEDSKWLYDQFSLKSNKEGLYGALTKSHKDFKDSLVPIKCYFLKVSNAEKKQLSEYVVTMLPQLSYYQKNQDYDYITKPNYSGFLMYSDKEGNLLKCEYLIDGKIIQCSILSNETNSTKSKPTVRTKTQYYSCLACGELTSNSNELCLACQTFFLDPIVVTGVGNNWLENYIWMQLHNFSSFELDYQTGNNGNGSPESPGGGVVNNDIHYTVAVNATGCYTGEIFRQQYVSGSTNISIYAPTNFSDSCWFKEWCLLGNNATTEDNTIIIPEINSNYSFIARYAYDDACSRFARLLSDTVLCKSLNVLLIKAKQQEHLVENERIEWAVTKFTDSNNLQVESGTRFNVVIKTNGRKATMTYHLHPGGIALLSGGDFGTMCSFFNNHSFDPLTFQYGIVADSSYLMITMKNFDVFNAFINSRRVERLPGESSISFNKRQRYKYKIFYAGEDKNDEGCSEDSFLYHLLHDLSSNHTRMKELQKFLQDSLGLTIQYGSFSWNGETITAKPNNTNYDYSMPYGCEFMINY